MSLLASGIGFADEVNSKLAKEAIKNEQEVGKEEVEKNLQISLIGDMAMDGSVRRQIDKNGYAYPWEKVFNTFNADDLTIGNLETSITTRGKKWPDKQFNFRSDPKNIKAMEDAGIEVVSLANNHSLDYGYEGLKDTLNHLGKSKINYVGGGLNKDDAYKGIILEKNGMKIGVLGFSRVIPDAKWYATNTRPGLAGGYDPHRGQMKIRIEAMKQEVDYLVVNIHWGVERSTRARKQEEKLARDMVDWGADIISGHHPHVLQGVEIYKGKPIFYSLGNFVFGSASKEGRSTAIAQVNIRDGKLSHIDMIPCEIIGGRPIPLYNNHKEARIRDINSLSKPYGVVFEKNGRLKLQ